MTPTQEELARALGRLRMTHDATELRLADKFDCPPEEVRDTSGRPYLESMQVALVNGYAALVTAEAQS